MAKTKKAPMDLGLDLSALQSHAVEQPDPVVEAERARSSAVVKLAIEPQKKKSAPEERKKSRAGRVPVQAYIEPEKRRALKVLAAQTDGTIEDFLARAIDQILAQAKT